MFKVQIDHKIMVQINQDSNLLMYELSAILAFICADHSVAKYKNESALSAQTLLTHLTMMALWLL